MKRKIIVYVLVSILLLEMFYLAGSFYTYYRLNKEDSGPNPFRVLNAVRDSEVGKYLASKGTPWSLDLTEDYDYVYEDDNARLIIDARTYEIKTDEVIAEK